MAEAGTHAWNYADMAGPDALSVIPLPLLPWIRQRQPLPQRLPPQLRKHRSRANQGAPAAAAECSIISGRCRWAFISLSV